MSYSFYSSRTVSAFLITVFVISYSAQKSQLQSQPHIQKSVERELTGRVREGVTQRELVPVARVRLNWLGTSIGGVTKSDGSFRIARPESAHMLVVRAVGFRSDTLHVESHDSVLDIRLEAVQTDAVEVEGTSGTIGVSQAHIKTETIRVSDLKRSACCSLSESFEKSGSAEVTFSDAVSGAKQIQLLGLRGTYTSLLMEAIPTGRGVAQPFSLDYFPGSWLYSISISKGAATVTTGYEPMTGQINIELQKPWEAHMPKLFVNLYGNSNYRGEANVMYQMRHTDEMSSAVMLHGRYFNKTIDRDDNNFYDQPKFNQWNALWRGHYQDESFEFQLLARSLRDNYSGGEITRSRGNYPNADSIRPQFKTSTSSERHELFLKSALRSAELEQSIGLQFTASKQSSLTQMGKTELDGSQTSLFGKLVVEKTWGVEHHAMIGSTLNFDDRVETIWRISEINRVRAHNPLVTLPVKETVFGGFAEYSNNSLSTFTAVGGVRFDKSNINGSTITPRAHIRWDITDLISARTSIGSGWRMPALYSENLNIFASNRSIIVEENIIAERSLNFGASITATIPLGDNSILIDAEFFRTNFSNQLVVDFDQSQFETHIYNLRGESFSNSGQVMISFSPFERFDVSSTYRINDAWTTTNNVLQRRPLISPARLLSTLSYNTGASGWAFDATLVWNSNGRIPSLKISDGTTLTQNNTTFPPFFRANAQVQKKFGEIELYIGCENITNFMQENAILSPDYSDSRYFDASMVWGSMDNRIVYFGLRYALEQE